MISEQNNILVNGLLGAINKRNNRLMNQRCAANERIDHRPALKPATSAIKKLVPAGSAGPSTSDQQRAFVLSVVQPGLAGLMDGSISSLAPLFAAAFATRDSWTAFLVGLATAIGAGLFF